ncbi:MAG: hypothetical protein PHS32_12420 [Rhodoferax sp.]|uniref:hypothetical protein n=1 Tax=Rhodoferax sp. TaxID=50421 RepID=UPI002631D71B|nr:hypothetical protein [Rhodoferax sp.]MDD5334536.1 hypothetical protein [Rhodoferax sp.]
MFTTPAHENQRRLVIAGLTRNPWMPDQVRHDCVSLVRVKTYENINSKVVIIVTARQPAI